MSLSISPLIPIAPIAGQVAAVGSTSGAGKSTNFTSLLDGVIQGVEQPRQEANQAIQNLLNGDGELHTVALAVQRADLTFDLGLQVRNKIVSAYQEIMRMQL
jgi:flagellar hook-basal body complex protein FliE